MGRGVGRPPKTLSRTNSQDSDGEAGSGNDDINSSTPSSYVAPQWLLEKQPQKFFAVPIPNVPVKTKSAILEKLLTEGVIKRSNSPSMKLMHEMRQLQNELHVHRQKVESHEEKLAFSIAARDEKLKEIAKARDLEIEKQICHLETDLLREHERRKAETNLKVRKRIEDEFDESFTHGNAKRRCFPENAKDSASTHPIDSVKVSSDQPSALNSTSHKLQEKLDRACEVLEKLTEMKSEMVWLLKQVIKTEMKQKMVLRKG